MFISKDVTLIEELYQHIDEVTIDIANEPTNEVTKVDDVDIDEDSSDQEGTDNAQHDDEASYSTPHSNRKRPPWVSGEYDKDEAMEHNDMINNPPMKDGTIDGRPRRKTKPPQRYGDYGALAFLTSEALAGNVDSNEPSSFEEAMERNENEKWSDAMMDEVNSLIDNGVFEVVNKPKEQKVIGCRWVYALKRDSRGSVVRHKARIAVKGYSQTYGVDYDEVYAPVVQLATLRFLFAYVGVHDMEMKQLDVKTAFLHGTLDENIYMEVPPLPQNVIKFCQRNHYYISQGMCGS